MGEQDEGRAWFALLAGIPAMIAWLAYGLCWLLSPRLAAEQDPLAWAAYAAGAWYIMVLTFTVGPIIFIGV